MKYAVAVMKTEEDSSDIVRGDLELVTRRTDAYEYLHDTKTSAAALLNKMQKLYPTAMYYIVCLDDTIFEVK